MGILPRIFVAEGRARLFWRVFGFFIAFMAFQGVIEVSYPPQRGVAASFVRTIVHVVVRTAGAVGMVALFRRSSGQLGNGTMASSTTPVPVTPF